jgi:hypothetical protein
MRAPKLALAGLLCLGLVIGSASAASAAVNLNLAIALTTPLNHTSVRTSYQVNNDPAGVVADGNEARAISEMCNNCRTVAVAVQIDLAAGPVVSVSGVNEAVSRTGDGSNDDTGAYAYQFIIAPSEQVVFTPTCTTTINGILADVTAIAKNESAMQRSVDIAGKFDLLNSTLLNVGCYQAGTPLGPEFNVTVNQRSQTA